MRDMNETNSEPPRGPAEAARLGDEYASSSELWMIHAMIQPFRLDAVTLALEQLPEFGGMTVLDCRGFGRGRMDGDRAGVHDEAGLGATAGRRDRIDVVELTRKVKLEIAVAGRTAAQAIIETIVRHAHTGRGGDGKVFAFPVGRAVRVRTYDTDERAL